MTASNHGAVKDRSGRGYLVGSGIFVVLSGLLAILRARPSDRTTAYFVGQIFGSLVMSALVAAVVFAIARATTRSKPRATAAKSSSGFCSSGSSSCWEALSGK
jgi:hypothetical protein